MKTLVITPTYNESESLPRHLGSLAFLDVDVLVVDDQSPDGTGRIAEEWAERDPRVHVLHREKKEGLGRAYMAGFAWGLERGYEVLVEMDADGSHRAEDLPKLLEAVEDSDVVLGSRWVKGGSVVNWPTSRKVLSRGGNWYVQGLLRMPLKDATGGFRAYRAEALREIIEGGVASEGYCFQVDMALRAVKQGKRVVEVPIRFVERDLGASKMSRSIILEALWRVTIWGVRGTDKPLG